jgi:hypothetical protein
MGEVQIADEAAQEEPLLDILLTKVRVRRLKKYRLKRSGFCKEWKCV